MAVTMVKTRHAFDLLINWHEYLNYINHEFSGPEDNTVWSPKIDLKEKNGHYLLRMDLPGVDLKDVHVKYSNGYLTIEGRRKDREPENEHTVRTFMTERSNGRFKRVLKFPPEIDMENIRKAFKNGILEISIPILNPKEQNANTPKGG